MALQPPTSSVGTRKRDLETPTPQARKVTSKATRDDRYIKDPNQLRHIVRHVDGFVNHVQSEQRSFSSWEEVRTAFEEHSAGTGKAAVGMNLVEHDGNDVGGFQFYFKQQPEKTTSGKHLVLGLNLDRDEAHYRPSNFAKLINLQTTQRRESTPELDLDTEVDLDLDLDSGSTELAELETLDSLNSVVPDGDFILEELEDEDELNPDLVAHLASAQGKNPSKRPGAVTSTPSSPVRSPTERYKDGRNLNDLDGLFGSAAKQGSEVNGINLAGLVGQLGVAGAAILANDDDLAKLYNRVLKKVEETGERVERDTREVESLRSPGRSTEKPAHQQETDAQVASEAQAFVEEAQEAEEPIQPGPVSDESNATNPLVKASNQLGQQVNRIEAKLAPEEDFQPLGPLELDPRADIEQKLLVIEAYLNKLNERLDRLEEMIGEIKQQLDEQKLAMAAETTEAEPIATASTELPSEVQVKAIGEDEAIEETEEADPTELEAAKVGYGGATVDEEAAGEAYWNSLTPEQQQQQVEEYRRRTHPQAIEEKAELSETARTVTQTVEAVSQESAIESPTADALAQYAWVTREVSGTDVIAAGIPLSDTKTLYCHPEGVNQANEQVGVQVVVLNQGATAFSATQSENNQWQVQTDTLSEQDKREVLKLPQSREHYESETLGQAFIEKLKQDAPDLFEPNESGEPKKEELGRANADSDFRLEISTIRNGPRKGKLLVEVFDSKADEPVFDAITHAQPGTAIEISQNDIPASYLQSVISPKQEQQKSQQAQAPNSSQNSKSQSSEQDLEL